MKLQFYLIFNLVFLAVFQHALLATSCDLRIFKKYADAIQSKHGPFNIHELNAFQDAHTLEPADAKDFEEFKNSTQYSRYRAQADQILAEGSLVKEFYFSGLDLEGKPKYSYMPGKGSSTGSPMVMPIPLGIRYILQYRLQMEKLAKQQGKDPAEYVKNSKLLLHVNHANRIAIEKDFEEFDWFGFSPENIVLLVQPLNNAYRIANGNFVLDNSVKRPGGHGCALEQTVRSNFGETYTFSSNGKLTQLAVNSLAYFRNKGAKWILSASGFDLTQMGNASLDPDRLAIALYLADQNHNLIMEMVENPSRRAGAYWVKNSQSSPFVVHTLELLYSNQETSRPLDCLLDKKALFSRFAYYVKLETLEEVLSNTEMPLYIESNDAGFTYHFLSFSHDLSRISGINSAAFHQKNEIVRLFRLDEDLPETLTVMALQDRVPEFKALAKDVYLKRAHKRLHEPLQFYTNWVKYPWGGSRILNLKNVAITSDDKIGETWEVSTQTRNPSYLMIDNQLQPLTLEDLMNDDVIAEKIVGSRTFGIAKNWFPVLYKFLDAAEILSVQVHPSTKLAEELGEGEPGKSETWVVIYAKPDAYIYVGLNKETPYEKFLNAIHTHENLLPLMRKHKVKAGDVLHNVPGVIHAIGAGVFVAEIQGNSDITYRLYDHHRLPARPTHIPQAMKAINMDLLGNYEYKPYRHPKLEQCTLLGSQLELLALDPYYEVRRATIKFYDKISIPCNGDFQIVSIIRGRANLRIKSSSKSSDWKDFKRRTTSSSKIALCQGQTVLVPASSNLITLTTKDLEAEVLFVSPGQDPRPIAKTEPIKLVEPTEKTNAVDLALCIRSSQLTVGALNSEGLLKVNSCVEWKKSLEFKGMYNAEAFIELIVDECEEILQALEKKNISRDKVSTVWVAWPGPGNYTHGLVTATFIPAFHHYPLGEKLKQRLQERLAMTVNIKIVLDAWADAYGEMSQDSTLKNWMYLNIATGVAAGIVKDGEILDAYDWPDKKGIESGLGQIGRHLIRLSSGKWEYRPTPNGEIPNLAEGEVRLTDWIGSQGLAKRFIDHIVLKAETTAVIPEDFFGMPIKNLKLQIEKRDLIAIKTVLNTVQKRAQEQNEFAIEMISKVGQDIGACLRVFAEAFPQEFFYNRIILGGDIGENLGKDIPATKSNTDILLYNIVQASQIPNIRRTKTDVLKKLLAFKLIKDPSTAELLKFDMDTDPYICDN